MPAMPTMLVGRSCARGGRSCPRGGWSFLLFPPSFEHLKVLPSSRGPPVKSNDVDNQLYLPTRFLSGITPDTLPATPGRESSAREVIKVRLAQTNEHLEVFC
jgi:hypothetical protein